MISPFLPPGYGANLTALVHLAWLLVGRTPDKRVAISLSPFESLLIPRSSVLWAHTRWLYSVERATTALPQINRHGSGLPITREVLSCGRRPSLD